MAKISSYIKDDFVDDKDKWIGTDSSTLRTKNFTAQGIADNFNRTSKIAVGGQISYKFYAGAAGSRPEGTISLPNGGGDASLFSSVTYTVISKYNFGGKNVDAYLQYLDQKFIFIYNLHDVTNFAKYNVLSMVERPTETNFYDVLLDFSEGNGTFEDGQYYGVVEGQSVAGAGLSGFVTINGTTNEVEVETDGAGQTFETGDTITVGLPDDVTIATSLAVNDYTLPLADGAEGFAAVTDGSGNLSFDLARASSVKVNVKNTHTGEITKGTPVYITGNVGNSETLEIAPADASDPAKMPAVGLAESTMQINDVAHVAVGGFLKGLVTDVIDGTSTTSNDTVYVKAGGGLTMTKPTGSNLIQNIAKVARVHGSAGSLVVSSILRANDVPNLTTGKIWVGDGNTIESSVIHLDESNNRLGVNTSTPGHDLDVVGDIKASGTVKFGSLEDTGESITITKIVDEADGIGNNDNDTSIPTSAAVVDYVATASSVLGSDISYEEIDNEFKTSSALTAGATVNIDFDAAQIFTLTPNQSTTLNITNPKVGLTKCAIVTGAGGSYTLSFTVGGASGTFNRISGAYNDTLDAKNFIQIVCVSSTEFWYSISQIAT
jgi:hypothetical protein